MSSSSRRLRAERSRALLLAVLGLSLLRCADAAPDPLRVFILAGQSNMAGERSNRSQLPPEQLPIQETALIFDGEQWGRVAPPADDETGFGPELSFANQLTRRRAGPIGVIKVAAGGSSLAADWEPRTGRLYAQLLERVKAARRSRPIEIVAMVWMQGEADAREADTAAAYAENLRALIGRVRRDLDSPRLIFLAGRVNPPVERFPYVAEVRRAQETVELENYSWVDCDSLSKHPDGVHYDTGGTVALGVAFAEAILERPDRVTFSP